MAGDRYLDDTYVVELEDVTLTVTPTSEANSAESGGRRVDGADTLTQPEASLLTATEGKIRGKFTPRFSVDDSAINEFNTYQYLVEAYIDSDNYIAIRLDTSVPALELVRCQGGVEETDAYRYAIVGDWNSQVEKTVELWWGWFGAAAVVDTSNRCWIPGATEFDSDFVDPVWWGSDHNGRYQYDGVIENP